MCLITNNKIQKAKHDMVCWKVVLKKRSRYYAPYQKFCYPKKQCEHVELKPNTIGIPGYFRIEEGYHSFTNIEDVRDELAWHNCRSDTKVFVIMECIIPKGSDYVLGDFENSNDAYVSSSIKIVKEL